MSTRKKKRIGRKPSPEDAPDLYFMPLIVNDFLSSPTIQAMSGEEIGAYMLLLMCCWSSGKCRVPRADTALRSIIKCGRNSSRVLRTVLPCFVPDEDPDYLTNAKLKVVWNDVVTSWKNEQTRAKKAAGARWGADARASEKGGDFDAHACSMHTENTANRMLYGILNTECLPAEDLPPKSPDSAGGFPDVRDDLSWGPIEAEFLNGTWGPLKGVVAITLNVMPKDLRQPFRENWPNAEWRRLAERAMAKFRDGPAILPGGNPYRASLKKFLNEPSWLEEVAQGKYDNLSATGSKGNGIKHRPGDRYDPGDSEDFFGGGGAKAS